MSTLMAWVVRRPVFASLLLLIGLIAAGSGLPRLQLDPSIDGLILDDSDKAYYENIKRTFGDDSVIVIYIKSDQLFSVPVLKTVETLTYALENISLKSSETAAPIYPVTNVRSIATVNRIEGQRIEGESEISLDTTPLMDRIPKDDEGLAALRKRALDSELFVGDIVSKDGKTTAINAFVAAAPKEFLAYDYKLVDAVEALLEQERAKLRQAGIKADIFSVGIPVAKVDLGKYIERDMRVLVPVALVLIFTILAFAFRTFTAMILPSLTGLLSVVAALGMMGWMGFNINLISNIVPLLLLVIGCTEDIYMLSEYADEVGAGHSKLQAIRNMAVKSGLAITLTSVTTILGFASMVSDNIIMLREFGIAAALGLFCNFLITVILIPIMLRILPIPQRFLAHRQEPTAHWVIRCTEVLIHWAAYRKKTILSALGLVMGLSLWGASTVIVNTDLIGMFQPDAPIVQKMDRLAEDLAGGQSFSIVIETHRPDGAKDPELLKAMLKFQEHLEQGPFDKVVSVANYLKAIHRESNGDDPAFNVVPDKGIAAYLMLLEGKDLDRLLESTYERTLIVVRHNINGSWKLNQEIEKVRQQADTMLPKYVSVKITGQGILFNKAADQMALDQASNLVQAAVSIFVVIALLFVSAKAGLLAMLPNLIPMFTTFGFMGLLDIPLSPGTCMVTVIALGIAVDDTIHIMAAFHKNLKTTADQTQAMEHTLREHLSPVLFSSVALGLGFSILAWSDISSSRDFGILASLSMFTAAISELLFTPLLLLSTQLVSSWDLLLVRVNREVIASSPLFGNFTPAEYKRILLLGVMEERARGETIVKKGEQSREMYLLLEGQASIMLDQKRGPTLKPGDIFGEMAFVTGERRSADVVASEDVSLLKIDQSVLDRVQKRFPKIGCKLFLNISQILSRRLEAETVNKAA